MQTEFEAKCPEIKGQKYLLFLSRVAKKKGLEILIKAYASLAIQNFKLPKLVIAGPGKESPFGQHLNELVDKNSLSDKIKFPGMLSGNSKWGAFYGCEAFVLPSHQENFGIAVAEALACAKPVLISNQVNIWMKIEEEQAGIVSQDTEKGVYDMLVKWHNSTLQEKKSMAINAKQAYTKNFEVESAAKLFRHAVIGHNQPQHQLNYSL
ncbi:MAG: glycosyltransferase [Bacteroidota bacterium]